MWSDMYDLNWTLEDLFFSFLTFFSFAAGIYFDRDQEWNGAKRFNKSVWISIEPGFATPFSAQVIQGKQSQVAFAKVVVYGWAAYTAACHAGGQGEDSPISKWHALT
jgi:hypothetical protein